MSEHIVKDITYIPVDINNFPELPDTPMLDPKIVKEVDIEHNYNFWDRSFKARFMSNLIYFAIFILVFPLQKIRYGLVIKGKKNIRKNRKLFKNGAITVSNHVYRWDFLAVLQAVKYRKLYFPARAAQVMSSDAVLIRSTGGIPIPSSFAGLRGFYKAFDDIHDKKKWIHVFPESCRWDYYEPIRPFKKGAFKMAIKYDIPVIPMVFSYRKPTGIYKLFKVSHPLITLSIGEPILPENKENLSKRTFLEKMINDTHQQMTNMAGIEQNKWPAFDSE